MKYPVATLLTYLRVPMVRRGVLLAVLGLAACWVAVGSYYLEAEADFARTRAEVIRISNARAAYENRVALANRYLELSAEVDDLDRKLAATVDRSLLVEQLADLSVASGTRIVHGANRFGEERNGIVPIIQDLTVDGSYEQIRRFLAGLDTLPTLTLLAAIDLGATPEGDLVRGRMQFVTYSEAPR